MHSYGCYTWQPDRAVVGKHRFTQFISFVWRAAAAAVAVAVEVRLQPAFVIVQHNVL